MLPSEYYVESCTLFDDQYLNYHDLVENSKSDSETLESKSQLNAGGFAYTIKNDYRFIIWRINGNELELIEQSLVYKLTENSKRIIFKNSMIIPRVHVAKDFSDPAVPIIQILIATTFKLYRLTFKVQLQEFATKSIFYNFTNLHLANIDPSDSYKINLQQVDNGNIFVTPSGEAVFAYILQNNSVSCIQMPAVNKYELGRPSASTPQNLPVKFELNQPSIVKRLWSGLSRNAQDTQPIIVSYKLFNLNDTTCLIGLCKDMKLRVFCLKTNQCIYVEDLVKYLKLEQPIIWEESMLDLINLNSHSVFSVVLTSMIEFRVCNLKIELYEGSVRLSEVSKKIVRKQGKLVNLSLSSSKVWLMYMNEQEAIEVVTIAISQSSLGMLFLEEGNRKEQRQMLRHDRSQLDEEEDSDYEDEELISFDCSNMDIKERYLKVIFQPYRFSRTNIFKALGVLTNSTLTENRLPNSNEELKKLIIESIEKEVQNHPNFSHVTEEEFLYLNSKCWLKFFTMLKQYDYDSRVPIGLFVDPDNESLITLIRKNAISVYTYADISQYNSSSHAESVRTFLTKSMLVSNDEHQSNDLLQLVVCVQQLGASLKAVEFHEAYENQKSVEQQFSNFNSVNNLTDSLIYNDKSFLTSICNHLNKISSLNSTIHTVISILNPDLAESDLDLDQSIDQMDIELNTGSNSYLKSEFTLNCVLSSFYHRVLRRSEFLKSLTILINIIRKCYENLDLSREYSEKINVKYFEVVLSYLNSYEYLQWLNSIYPVFVSKTEMDKNVRRVLDLGENNPEECLSEIKMGNKCDNMLIKSFMQSFRNKRIFDVNCIAGVKDLTRFNQVEDYLVQSVFKKMWPLNTNESLDLIRYLLLNGQYTHLNNYCLSTKWMQKGKGLRYFLLANCCLFFYNIDQSIDLFLKASHFLNNDNLLKNLMKLVSEMRPHLNEQPSRSTNLSSRRKSINITKTSASNYQNQMDSSIFGNTSNVEMFDRLLEGGEESMENTEKILLDYYIKVIHYYDLNGNIEAAIELVQDALLIFQFDLKSKSTLHCILFNSYMSLEYYEKAHASIISNMDLEWKLTCLKHFISELCNQNKTSQLVSFDYGELHQDVLKILYERASRSDLRTHDYYNIIYSLHIKHKNYLKAAYCMLESATRLKKELVGIHSLKRQERCYLACLNVLKLVDKKYAWIARPTVSEAAKRVLRNPLLKSPSKQRPDSNEVKNLDEDVQIVDMEEINKNYMATYYMVKLSTINQNQSNIGNFYNTDEIVALLIKFRLFDDAVVASGLFKAVPLPMEAVFVGLVDSCSVQESKDMFQSELDFAKNNDSIESYSPYESPSDFKWRLLISYLTKFNDTEYYKIVSKRLLKNGYEIPNRITSLFKRLDLNALLKIYMEFNFWDECVQIISEQIDMNISQEDDLKSSNKFSTMSYNNIDKILYVLSKSRDETLTEKGADLKQKLNEYLSQIQFASQSMVNRTSLIC